MNGDVVEYGNGQDRAGHRLKARRLGIETQHEAIVFMHRDCPVCRSEGFVARTQIELHANGRSALATLFQVTSNLLAPGDVGLSEVVWRALGAEDGDEIKVKHPQPLASMSLVRAKVYGHRLDLDRLRAIIADIVAERYSDVQLATFITAFASQPAEVAEVTSLTHAMLEVGDRLAWSGDVIVDKHCVGGLPANRTTPIVVAIVAAAGLTIPKTSSRAITSPAGTADAMETMAPVNLDMAAMRRVVDREGGCIVWGGSVALSPADDILIRVERALDVDSDAQLVASVLSKKLAAGATHVLVDLPVGPTAKIRTTQGAEELGRQLVAVGGRFGLKVQPMITDGTQPVGRGIGPALEARDVLAVLRNDPAAPADLRDRAVQLAAAVLELGGGEQAGAGTGRAAALLESGAALAKFMAICNAQGGFREPRTAPLTQVIAAPRSGRVVAIDNRLLARVAKLAGAPHASTAGVDLHVKLDDPVERGAPLITLHGESRGEIAYARAFADANPDMLRVVP